MIGNKIQVETTASTSTAAEDRLNLAWLALLTRHLTRQVLLKKPSPTSKRCLQDQAECVTNLKASRTNQNKLFQI
jgi:hypothetical protein